MTIRPGRVRRAPAWLALGAATAALGWALGRAGVPASYLFAALLVGLATALARPLPVVVVPAWSFGAAQAITGVTLGAFLQTSSLRAIGDAWLAVTLVSAATLALSLCAGLVLARATSIDRPTATLGTIAGGASGIVAMARELHGDEQIVAFIQYARVLVVVLLTPLLIPLTFPGHQASAVATDAMPLVGDERGWLLTAVAGAAGVLLARPLRLPAGTLLGPLTVAGALTLSGAVGGVGVPALLREPAFAIIGLQVGLGFTPHTVRRIGRLVAPVLATVIALLAACAALGAVLAATTRATPLDGYLATTPGGLAAVAPVAVGAGADATFVVAVQGLRLLVMVLVAPLAVRYLAGRPGAVLR